MSSAIRPDHQATPTTPEPALRVCDWCAGSGIEPDESCAAVPCLLCDGGGYAEVDGDLGPTHAHKVRTYRYNPGRGWLLITRGRKPELYRVSEFTPDTIPGDLPARAFSVRKVSDESLYHVLCTRAAVHCDCAGSTYEASARANRRAHERGDRTHATAGCVHADAVRALLTAGLLDLPNPHHTHGV